MKHAFTLLIATVGCSQPAQRSAFDPKPVAQPSPDVPLSGGSGLAASVEHDTAVETEEFHAVEMTSVQPPQKSETATPLEAMKDVSAVTVRAGESLDRLSRWSDASVEEIAALNAIEITAPLVPGQILAIPIADRESFESSRNGALELRLERYLAANGGLAGIEGYTVRTGDTAWAIAKEIAGVPSWVLAAFNGDASLDHLSVGATIYLPIMTHVVDAELPMDEISVEMVEVNLEADLMD